MALFLVNLVAVAGSLSGKIFLSRWLVAWCLVLAAFGVESVQPFSPEHALQVEQLFAAVVLPCRDVSRALLGSGGRILGLKMASCLLGAFFCTFIESIKKKRVLIYLAQVEWLQIYQSMAHLVAIAGSLSGKVLMTRWLLAWCSFLAAFGVKSLQPLSPKQVL